MARAKPTVKRGRGRPPTGHKTIRFRVPPDLFAALERRLEILDQKSCLTSVSFYLRQSLEEKLGKDLRADRRDRAKTPRSA